MKLLREEKETKGRVYRINSLTSDLDETFLEDTNLTEDADSKVSNGSSIEINEGDMEKVLNRALKVNKANVKLGLNEFVNILFEGAAGVGKTARIEAWARNNGVNLVSCSASTMDETDLGGAISPDKDRGEVKRYSSVEFDQLDEPNSVLFLDELNRAPSSVAGTMLTLINNHTIIDPRVKGRARKFKGFLFTIAAINPSTGADYDVEVLDQAMLDRFVRVEVKNDPQSARNYFVKTFDKLAKSAKAEGDEEEAEAYLGRKNLADALLSHPDFDFEVDPNSGNDGDPRKTFSTRSLMGLLLFCDGTKQDFLDKWDSRCKHSKKEMAIRILNDYKDKNDKANDALFNHETESELFTKKESAAERLKNAMKAKMQAQAGKASAN